MPGDKTKQAPTTSEPVVGSTPAYLKNTAPATLPSGLPGQIPALAQQLGIGFGIPPQAFAKALNQVYRPAQTMQFNMPPPTPKTPTTPPPKPDPKIPTKPSDKFTYVGGRNAR